MAPPLIPLELRLKRQTAADVETGCVNWTGVKNHKGYGRLRVAGRLLSAHRVAYELANGPIPPGLVIDHLCRNRACVNPAHLEVVTLAENKRRGESAPAVNARKTHCAAGHAFDGEHGRINPRGRRYCQLCGNERLRANRARWRAEAA